MKKKLILALAISVILTCLFAFAVSAAEYQQNEKGIWYSTSDEIPPKEYVNYFVTATEGTVGETAVEAFNSFYVSKDNGVVWKAPESFYQLLPKVLN